jgi:hypothetical protein
MACIHEMENFVMILPEALHDDRWGAIRSPNLLYPCHFVRPLQGPVRAIQTHDCTRYSLPHVAGKEQRHISNLIESRLGVC